MSLYSKINIISEYITPNGYLFSGYSQQDLTGFFDYTVNLDSKFNTDQLNTYKTNLSIDKSIDNNFLSKINTKFNRLSKIESK